MEDQYGRVDLRQYITSGTPLFRQPPPEFASGHQGLSLNPPNNPYGMLMFCTDSNNSITAANPMAAHGGGGSSGSRLIAFESGENVNSGRWPRQETLTLLEIRSRLDSKFKEANQKGPLWDEVSRIMSEEYGYQRSGKKCREKFENLYKYYKKTKEGKAGRQDGKHYRFFRQLDALYGEPYNLSSASASVPNPLGESFPYKNSCSINREGMFQAGSKLSDTSLSLSNYSDADMSYSSGGGDSDLNEGIEDVNDLKSRRVRGKKGWKVEIRDIIDGQMKKLMDKQEAWMEGMMRTMEDKEQQRLQREDQWRKQDAARIERERELWASERAWIEARDAALMEALHKLTGNQEITADIHGSLSDHGSDQTMPDSVKGSNVWLDCEVNRLIELRSDMELKFQQQRRSPEDNQAILWDEISGKMVCFGHHRSGLMCKEKWEETVGNNLNYLHKRRMEMNSKPCIYNPIHHQGIPSQGFDHHTIRLNDPGNSSSPPNGHTDSSATAAVNDHCFRYLMGDTYARLLD